MHTDRPMWRSRAWVLAAGLLLALAVVVSVIGVDSPTAQAVVVIGAAVIALAVVVWTQQRIRLQRRRFEDELAQWASARAAQAERLRIAADLHDLVSHGLGLVTVRAAAARSMTGPEADVERRDALADIERVGRETTTELRRMLTVLRERGAAPLRPADSLDDLPGIVDAAAQGGLTVMSRIDELGDVSAGAQLTVCAVVREALANALRHAGRTTVRVDVGREGETIVVVVEDNGPAESWAPHPGAGHGLAGVRDRVAALDGALDAAPTARGFRVTARIPDWGRP